MARPRHLAFVFIITVVVPVLVLVAIEVAARLYIHFEYGVPGKSYGLWRYDADLGAQHNENAYNTNAQTNDYGFRNTEDIVEPKPSGSWRIIAYGGSTTFCYNLNNSETWPARLQQHLRNSGRSGDQVLNGGAIMWSIGHAYARAKKDVPQLQPDYVIIYSGINERANAQNLALDGPPMAELVTAGHYGAFARNLDQNRWSKRNLALVRMFDYYGKQYLTGLNVLADGATQPETALEPIRPDPDPMILRNYLKVLEQFIDLVQNQQGKVIFVVQAHDRNNAENGYRTLYSRIGADIASSKGAIVIDAQKMVDTYAGTPDSLFAPSGVHYSAVGADELAKYISGAVFLAE